MGILTDRNSLARHIFRIDILRVPSVMRRLYPLNIFYVNAAIMDGLDTYFLVLLFSCCNG